MGQLSDTFEIRKLDQYVGVKLKAITNVDAMIFESEIMPMLNEKPTHVIVQCDQVFELTNDWLRVFTVVKNFLKTHDKFIALVMIPSKLKRQLRETGMDQGLKCYQDPREAFAELKIGGSKKTHLNTDFINPFLTGTVHVLEVLAQVKAVVGEIFIRDRNKNYPADISGVISVVSDSFSGSVCISFPEATFLGIMSSMLGETYTSITQDIVDGAGELTNMIFGHAKVILNANGHGIKTAIPSVISGKGHSLSGMQTGTSVMVPFTSSVGDFFVEICIKD